MLPFAISVEEYNIIREWCVECNATVSVKVDNFKGEITIYTDKPGYMIGPRGSIVDKYQKKLKDAFPHRKKPYKFLIEETTMNISPQSPVITEEDELNDFAEYCKYRFGDIIL